MRVSALLRFEKPPCWIAAALRLRTDLFHFFGSRYLHLGHYVDDLDASSCMKNRQLELARKKQKDFLNFFPISCRGVPLPPMYTQFHPRSPNPGAPDTRGFRVVGWGGRHPRIGQRVAAAELLTTRDFACGGWHPAFFKFCCKQKYFSHSTLA